MKHMLNAFAVTLCLSTVVVSGAAAEAGETTFGSARKLEMRTAQQQRGGVDAREEARAQMGEFEKSESGKATFGANKKLSQRLNSRESMISKDGSELDTRAQLGSEEKAVEMAGSAEKGKSPLFGTSRKLSQRGGNGQR